MFCSDFSSFLQDSWMTIASGGVASNQNKRKQKHTRRTLPPSSGKVAEPGACFCLAHVHCHHQKQGQNGDSTHPALWGQGGPGPRPASAVWQLPQLCSQAPLRPLFVSILNSFKFLYIF